MKKYLLLFVFILSFAGISQAQMLTRFAVVDLNRVYLEFFSQSRAVRDFEDRSARVQAEVDRMTLEIQNLRVNMVNARTQGNNDLATRIELDISRRTDLLNDYHRTQRAAMETQLNNLSRSSSFLDEIYDEIRFIAESEGFSAVLRLGSSASMQGILWYSPTVDITDRLIQSLRNRR